MLISGALGIQNGFQTHVTKLPFFPKRFVEALSWILFFGSCWGVRGTLLGSFWRSLGSKWGVLGGILGVWWRPWVPWARSLRQDPLPSFSGAPFLAILAPKGSPRGSQNGAKIDKKHSKHRCDFCGTFGAFLVDFGVFGTLDPRKLVSRVSEVLIFKNSSFSCLG